MSIGQGGVLVTPLQIADATVVVANSGKLIKPHILGSILGPNGNVISTVSPDILNNQVVSAQSINIVRDGMRLCVTAGSCKELNSLPVPAAGKTGTAQFGPNNSKEHAWFTSFAPFDNPTIELTILLEGAGGGDVYAEPVADQVYQYYFTR
jgi:cell division protein FtsI/penicillin-binding protein 2